MTLAAFIPMGSQPDVRASDENRERAAAEIREHFAQGRLSSAELSDRLDRAYGAQTVGELKALRADLPALPPTKADSRAELSARRSELSRHLVQQTGYALTPFFVCVAIWLFSGASGGFWPVFLLIPAALLLIRNGWRIYGPSPELDRAEQEIMRHRHRNRRPR
jgi:Domain of unknown function (DUF1707)